jgi:hypothetical protein
VSKPTITPVDTQALAVELQAIERRLYDAGLVRTAKAINAANISLGWEACEVIEAQTGQAKAERKRMRALFNVRTRSRS